MKRDVAGPAEWAEREMSDRQEYPADDQRRIYDRGRRLQLEREPSLVPRS